MIVAAGVAIFIALFILVYLAIPGQKVRRSRLGIERKPVDVGRTMNDFLERRGKRRGLANALALADIRTDPGQFALRVLCVCLLAGVVGLVLSPLMGLVGAVAPLLVIRTWVRMKGSRRQAQFGEQVPDMLQLLIASMKSGFGFAQAMEILVEEIDEPARSELAQVMAETRMGRDLSDSLRALSQRMDNEDLDWVIGAIDINRETGGNLAGILENVNGTIRERQRIHRKVRTFTAEGRFSAWILTAFPVILFLLQWRINPDTFDNFFHGLGMVFLFIAGLLLIAGWTWLRKISTVKF